MNGEPKKIHGFQSGISPRRKCSRRKCLIGTMNGKRSRKAATRSTEKSMRKSMKTTAIEKASSQSRHARASAPRVLGSEKQVVLHEAPVADHLGVRGRNVVRQESSSVRRLDELG